MAEALGAEVRWAPAESCVRVATDDEAEETAASAAASAEKEEVTVYIAESGNQYHRLGCRCRPKNCVPAGSEDARGCEGERLRILRTYGSKRRVIRMANVLRNFLYLDEQLIEDYLATIERMSYDGEVVVESTQRTGGASGGLSFGPIQGAGKKESVFGVQVTREARMVPASRFQKLYDHLTSNDMLQYYEAFLPETWASLQRHTFLETVASIRFSRLRGLSSALERISQLASVVEDATGQPALDHRMPSLLKATRDLEQLHEAKGVPCILTLLGSPDYRLIAYLNRACFRVQEDQIIGEVDVLCKVQRKLHEGETLELVDILPDLKKLALNRQQRRSMPKDLSTPAELRDTVRAPAAVVIPIAIYR